MQESLKALCHARKQIRQNIDDSFIDSRASEHATAVFALGTLLSRCYDAGERCNTVLFDILMGQRPFTGLLLLITLLSLTVLAIIIVFLCSEAQSSKEEAATQLVDQEAQGYNDEGSLPVTNASNESLLVPVTSDRNALERLWVQTKSQNWVWLVICIPSIYVWPRYFDLAFILASLAAMLHKWVINRSLKLQAMDLVLWEMEHPKSGHLQYPSNGYRTHQQSSEQGCSQERSSESQPPQQESSATGPIDHENPTSNKNQGDEHSAPPDEESPGSIVQETARQGEPSSTGLWALPVFVNSKKEEIAVHVDAARRNTDHALFTRFRQKYYVVSSRWQRFFQLRGVSEIQFVRVSQPPFNLHF